MPESVCRTLATARQTRSSIGMFSSVPSIVLHGIVGVAVRGDKVDGDVLRSPYA